MGYGKHQSFYLRNNWISKGINAISENGSTFFFDVNENYKKIGLGKNMFESLKFWLEATNIVEVSSREHIFTPFGEFIKKYDIGCQQLFTQNLLHYYLVCSEKPNGIDRTEAFFWYFNVCEEYVAKKERILTELIKWDSSNHGKSTSEKTLNKDLDAIISTYSRSKRTHPEDKMTSILSSLSLVKIQDGLVVKSQLDQKKLSYKAIMYILIRMNEHQKISSLSSLLDEFDSPGKLFNISRSDMIEIIENMIANEYPIQISRTNNLDTIVITTDVSSDEYLAKAKGDNDNENTKKFQY